MTDFAAEIASAILLLFVGGGVILTLSATLYGGDVTTVTSLISALAVPVTILAILGFFAIAILENL